MTLNDERRRIAVCPHHIRVRWPVIETVCYARITRWKLNMLWMRDDIRIQMNLRGFSYHPMFCRIDRHRHNTGWFRWGGRAKDNLVSNCVYCLNIAIR